MDLAVIFKLLFRKKWYLIGIPFLVVLISLIITSDYRQIFRSTAQLSTGYTITQEVDPTNSRFNIYETDIKFSNLIETMNSSRVLSLLSYRLILHDLDTAEVNPFTKLELKNEEFEEYNEIDLDMMRSVYRNKIDSMQILNTYNANEKDAHRLLEFYGYDFESLKKAITVRRVSNTDYVSIVAFTENPLLSAYAVNTLCDEFMQFNSSLSSERTSDAIEVYAKLLQEKRKELDLASNALQRYKSSARTVNLELERESQFSRVSELQLEIQQERKKINAINVQLEDINRRLRSGNAKAVTNADIINIRNRISSMNERYIASGSNNQVLRDSLQVLRETQQRYIRIYSQENTNGRENILDEKSELEVELQIARQNIRDLEESISAVSSSAGGFASKEARISQLERELDLASEEYKEAQEKYNLALNFSITSSNSIDQILQGLPADKPEPSKRLIVSAISGASTFIVIILIFLLLEYLDVSIKDQSNFKNQIDLNLIGVVNHMDLSDQDISKIFKESDTKQDEESDLFLDPIEKIKRDFGKLGSLFSSKSKIEKVKVKTHDHLKDQMRKLRFNILSAEKKVLLVTSTKPNEGKSTLMRALSVALSQGDLKVLIIDSNFHHNTLTKTFDSPKLLESVISNNYYIEDKFLKKNIFPNVDILGCKGGDYTPVEINGINNLKVLLERLVKKYDYILLEGAALNVNSNSRELTPFVEGVVSVFSAKSTIRQSDYDSITFLKNLGDKNLGAVLNDIELKDSES